MRLNPQQQAALDYDINASSLIVAGAGSGKTTVIAHRALRLLQELPPNQSIQMLTFSNKAAKEMGERIRRIGGTRDDRILFDTYHSWGLKRLKDDPQGFDLDPGFSLMTDTDTKRTIAALAKAAGLPAKLSSEDKARLTPRAWLGTWSLARQAGYDVNNPANKEVLCERLANAHSLDADEVAIAWATLSGYEREKRLSNCVDFDDLLYFPLLRLARDPGYAASIAAGIGHVIIDEFQDTNRIQYEMVRRWVCGRCPVTAVGDDDQSIYGWRGAEVTNIKRFSAHFKAAELRLEQNYRSTQAIVNSATALIRHNEDRLEKTPFSTADEGVAPNLHCYDDSRAMSDAIGQQIAAWQREGVPACEVAILYRTNRMAIVLESALRQQGIPYHVVGGMSLFDRAEVVAVSSALRLGVNPRDVYAMKNVATYIDGIGPGSVYQLQEWLEADESRSLMSLAVGSDVIPGLSESRLNAVKGFYRELVAQLAGSGGVREFIGWVVQGPMRLLERESNDEMRQRRKEFIDVMADDVESEVRSRQLQDPRASWQEVMLDAALREAQQSEVPGGQVTLSTVHRAKGLEWDHVIIAGMSDGLMPLTMRADIDESDAAFNHQEEERRLAFVGVTRARKTCTAVHADRYFFPGQQEDREYPVSPYAFEMGAMITDFRLSNDNGGFSDFDDFDDLESEASPSTWLASLRKF